MPQPDPYQSQPPLELLRQFLDSRGFYDSKKLQWKEVHDVTLLAACAPPGGGRSTINDRLLRHFRYVKLMIDYDIFGEEVVISYPFQLEIHFP